MLVFSVPWIISHYRGQSMPNLQKKKEQRQKAQTKLKKKAKSFKDEIRDKIIRRTSSSSGPRSPSPQKMTSRSPKRKPLTRGNSFNEGNRSEHFPKEDDMGRLEQERKKVLQALRYLQDVVDKQMLQMLPGSATIVLETVMEMHQLLANFFLNHDSSVLMSTYNKVYQSLANLIKWADYILLHGEKALNCESATEIISNVSDGIKDLISLAIDKLQNNKPTSYQTLPSPRPPKTPVSPGAHSISSRSSTSDSLHHSSLPEIPLSEHELNILRETQRISQVSLSSDEISDTSTLGSPPPKPPLPEAGATAGAEAFTKEPRIEEPPPLPDKRRSHNSLYSDRVSTLSGDSSVNMSPHSSFLFPSQGLPTPGSVSPSSSVSSMLSGSSEDLLSDKGEGVKSSVVQRTSAYDNVTNSVTSRTVEKTTEICTVTKVTSKVIQVRTKGGQKVEEEVPPPLPDKKCPRARAGSEYDNVPLELDIPGVTVESRVIQSSQISSVSQFSSKHNVVMRNSQSCLGLGRSAVSMMSDVSYSETVSSSSGTSSLESLQKPPPLPPKQRHVHAYMQMFGKCTDSPSMQDFSRHSVNFYQEQWFQHQRELFHPFQLPRSNTISTMSSASSRTSDTFSLVSTSSGEDPPGATPLPMLPPKLRKGGALSPGSNAKGPLELLDTQRAISLTDDHQQSPKAIEGPKRASEPVSPQHKDQRSSPQPEVTKDGDSDFSELSILDDVDVSDQLIRKKEGEDGPDIRGGSLDALIVHATASKQEQGHDFMYQEAFLTTYRTFIIPKELLEKLIHRYSRFARIDDNKRKKLARNTFSLLVRVVDELWTEIDEELIQMLMDLVFRLLCDGELMLARILRRKLLEKNDVRQQLTTVVPLSSLRTTAKAASLTEFRSEHLAEQMTLLDWELFNKIEIPEVLLWSKEQSEEHSPNLTKFTEHFNKMSYWCRTRVLQPEDPRERERFYQKFIKIMKHLRKLNNFNSFLAILSALDSAPIRRLDWPRTSQELLKDFCQLIDSSSSFRAYRQALGETEPPCIPYLGLILQDLTFVHIGNPDHLPDGSINFAKRWQQFNILDNMRRFKLCTINVSRNPKIIDYFNAFDDHLSEESLWQISETIRPRGGKKIT